MNLATNNINLTDVKKNTNLIRRYIIVGERRLSNYWWASVIFLGACGFLYTGISAYLGQSLFDFIFSSINVSANQSQTIATNTFEIAFFPQGLLMSFYGSLGLLLSLYWVLLIFWNVGGGFNEFNKKDGFIRIFRWGYPGKNRKIDLVYSLKDVEAIRVELKQGLDPQRTIFLRLKGNSSLKNNSDISNNTKPMQGIKREIPLTGISQPLTLKEIEKQASELANFLQVSLEGL
jgi:Ycf4